MYDDTYMHSYARLLQVYTVIQAIYHDALAKHTELPVAYVNIQFCEAMHSDTLLLCSYVRLCTYIATQ